VLSLKLIAAIIVASLLAPTGQRADDSAAAGTRFLLVGPAPPAFTLLDPAWLLPPIEALDTPIAPVDRAGQLLRDGGADATQAEPLHPTSDQVGYSLSDDVSAKLGYHHSQLSDRADSQTLREDQWSGFSTHPDRDVLDLNMSWDLAGSTVGLGYQLESQRGATALGYSGLARFLPGNPLATHSITLGLTRRWGAGPPPPSLEPGPLLLPPDLAVAAAEGTPTPGR